MKIQSFKDLIVWQKAMILARLMYQATAHLPSHEAFGLTSQMRRCAVSIPSNIAEGYHRKTRKDYLQFLHIADGSSAELETQILLAKQLYPGINFAEAEARLPEVQKMLGAIMKKLKTSP